MRTPIRHLVLVVLLTLFVAPVGAAADARVAESVGDDVMIQEPARERDRVQRARQRARTPEEPTPTAEVPAPPPRAPSTAPVIAADGHVETLMADGSTRRSRPGSECGATIVHPDGRTDTKPCYHIAVQKARLPAPDGASAAWLAAHGDSLLEIARGLLGGNARSLDNYLKTIESENPGVYERIRLRTDLISKLMGQ